ncbi:hypothetical protein [Anaerovorax sp. IOR16]|uniref:hypothetical protein n=1 Tax=Anaerovorax sp. IOR16 TaxID=2773458 RepID=UPI0019D2105C|nr:hypothetical protein [Anaerovorax sp. IOR16]
MKKILSLMLVLLFALGMTTISFADSYSFNNNCGIHMKQLTDEQAIQRISEINAISIEEARELFQKDLDKSKAFMTRGYENVEVYYSHRVAEGYEVTVGAIVRMIMSAGYSEYSSVISGSEYAVASGIGNYTYNAGNASVIILSPKKIQFLTAGTFEIAINSAITTEIKNELIGAGFSYTSSSNTYLRKFITVDYIETLAR